MSQQSLTSIAPYFDDFDSHKEYYAMLFNPARPVQARELTQMQTILQNQVGSFAKHVFNDNSLVINANIEHSTDKFALQVLDDAVNYPGSADLVTLFLGKLVTSNGTTSKVISVDQENFKLVFEYVSGVGFSTDLDDSLQGPLGTSVDLVSIVSGSIKNATTVKCADGIIFADNMFLVVKAQEIVVDSDVDGIYHVGYVKSESIVTSIEDSSLGDPSNGTNNASSPGADRYHVELTLTSYIDGQSAPANFIEFFVIEDKIVTKDINTSDYSNILDILAERTSDTNGDYSVEDFPINIDEHATDDTKLNIELSAGKAYVSGYEAEITKTKIIELNKARETLNITNDASWFDGGTYFVVASTNNGHDIVCLGPNAETPDFVIGESIIAYGGLSGTGATLGSLTVTGLKRVNSELRLYVTDVDSISGTVSSIVSVGKTYSSDKWYANLNRLAGFTTLFGQPTSPIVEYLEYQQLKSVSAISHYYNKMFKGLIVNSSGQIVLNGSGGDSFGGLDDIITVTKRNGTAATASFHNSISISGAGTSTLTLSDSSNFVTGDQYDINVVVYAETVTIRTKTKNTGIEANVQVSSANPKNSAYTLGHEDVYAITKIYQTDNFLGGDIDTANASNNKAVKVTHNSSDVLDVTEVFTSNAGWLDTGQRDVYYETAEITGLNHTNVSGLTSGSGTTNYIVVYSYYEHSSSGKCFTADSYETIEEINDYSSINNAITYGLSNSIDFRFKKSELSLTPTYPYQDRQLTSNVEIYLSRYDTVFIDKNGNFGINEGIPSTSPVEPDEISDTMTIYTLNVPAYTPGTNSVIKMKNINKNYTMKEIGNLHTRLENLEEIASLSLLEKSAADLTIVDPNGLEMYKSGIFVDSFESSDLHNKADPDYSLAINTNSGFGTGISETFDLEMIEAGATSYDWAVGLHTVSLAYVNNSMPLVENTQVTKAKEINPFDFKRWNGGCVLIPNFTDKILPVPPVVVYPPRQPPKRHDLPVVVVLPVPPRLEQEDDWWINIEDEKPVIFNPGGGGAGGGGMDWRRFR